MSIFCPMGWGEITAWCFCGVTLGVLVIAIFSLVTRFMFDWVPAWWAKRKLLNSMRKAVNGN